MQVRYVLRYIPLVELSESYYVGDLHYVRKDSSYDIHFVSSLMRAKHWKTRATAEAQVDRLVSKLDDGNFEVVKLYYKVCCE